ncbi:MAG TPA: hypothetical protein VK184_01415 [Nostocaceae cyanobacterium]|nr:hypothetical protein [Nostocaceae cyanobacterium]
MTPEVESNQQQVKKNEVVLLYKAQIAIDTLPKQQQEKITQIINCLEYFPHCSQVEYKSLKSMMNYFLAKVGIYRIVFEFNNDKVTIVEIVNYERIKLLYNS